jgi:hypothetical protein
MPTKIYRLGDNLYRWDGAAHGNGWPVGVESFVKDAETRKIIGRWLDCPNWGVAKKLRDRSAA